MTDASSVAWGSAPMTTCGLRQPPGASLPSTTSGHPCTDGFEANRSPRALHLLDARFASLGVPAVAFGPGDPSLAGSPDEFVPTAELTQCEFVLRQWLNARP